MTQPTIDFFISYTQADRHWASGLSVWLQEAGYTTILQATDFSPGSNFVLEMQTAAIEATRTLAILSPDYLVSRFPQPEWAAAFSQDPTGSFRKLVTVRVRECEPAGLLKSIVYIDLCAMTVETAKEKFLSGIHSAVQGVPFPQYNAPVPSKADTGGFPTKGRPNASASLSTAASFCPVSSCFSLLSLCNSSVILSVT
jgi:hypothetical protein